jgi:hypothetical protein
VCVCLVVLEDSLSLSLSLTHTHTHMRSVRGTWYWRTHTRARARAHTHTHFLSLTHTQEECARNVVLEDTKNALISLNNIVGHKRGSELLPPPLRGTFFLFSYFHPSRLQGRTGSIPMSLRGTFSFFFFFPGNPRNVYTVYVTYM